MKRILLTSIILLETIISTAQIKENSLFNQLAEINNNWNLFKPNDPELLLPCAILSEQDKIQTHLLLVEKYLRNNTQINYSKAQYKNRNKCLDILHKYAVAKVFPKNTRHLNMRVPYFIDDVKTPCAVGHLIIETGFEKVAQKINTEDNYAYIKDLVKKYPAVVDWANKFGFEESELAWIQPSYNCFPGMEIKYFNLSNTNLVQNPTCFGNTNGVIKVDSNMFATSPKPLIATIKYLTNFPTPTNSAATMRAGTYTITISDANSVSTTMSYLLTEPPNTMVPNIVTTPSGCNKKDSTGSIQILGVTGGVAPYNYLLKASYINSCPQELGIPIVDTQSFFNNLPGGYYFLYIKDSLGCEVISNPTEVLDSSTYVYSNLLTPINCNNTSLQVEIVATNMIQPNLSTYDTIMLPTGTYTVTGSNIYGCTRTSIVNIPSNFWTPNISNISPTNCITNTATVNIGLNNQINYNVASFTGLGIQTAGVGIQNFIITDSLGCKDTIIANIQPSPSLVSNITVSNPLCFGGMGTIDSIMLLNSNSWFTSNYTVGQLIPAGNYTLITTDILGCTGQKLFTIAEPAQLQNQISYNPIVCKGDYTIINHSIVGGTGQYSTSSNPNGIFYAGIYTVTTTDANGCITTNQLIINEPSNTLILSTPVLNYVSNGVDVNAIASGGTGNYVYEFRKHANGIYAFFAQTNSLPYTINQTGDYHLIVRDSNGCEKLSYFAVTLNPNAIDVISNNNIKFGPNPFTNYIEISNVNYKNFGLDITIIDIFGKIVSSAKIKESSFKIETSNLLPGIYLIKVGNTYHQICKY